MTPTAIASSYESEFAQALGRTSAWGLDAPSFQPSLRRWLSDISVQQLTACLQEATGHLQARDVAGQCFAMHTFLREPLEQALGVPLVLTLGYVGLLGRPVFHTPIDELRSRLRGTVTPGSQLSLHTWLTLPSHEIIDLTFGITYAVANGNPDPEGRCTFLHPSDLKGGQTYHPQLMGEAYFERIGVLMTFPAPAL